MEKSLPPVSLVLGEARVEVAAAPPRTRDLCVRQLPQIWGEFLQEVLLGWLVACRQPVGDVRTALGGWQMGSLRGVWRWWSWPQIWFVCPWTELGEGTGRTSTGAGSILVDPVSCLLALVLSLHG